MSTNEKEVEKKVDNNKDSKVEKKEVSKSMQKRIDRKKKLEQEKREGLAGAIIGVLAILLILGGIGYSIVSTLIKSANTVEPSAEYGKFVTEAGMVEGVTASKIVTLPADYASITIPYSEVEYTDEEFETDKQQALDNHPVLDTETDKHIEDGDNVNIDYVGTIDGVAFDGGSTEGAGTDLVIGSGSYIDGFETQIIGHQIGDNFDINVTFPADYQAAELAGQDAVFNITVNGIYVEAIFDDTFVAENLTAYATTVDEYKAYLKERNETSRKEEYVANYVSSNSSVSKYPKKFFNHLKSTRKYQDMQSYEYMNNMYAQYGLPMASSFEEYMQMSEEEYDISLNESCKEDAIYILSRQAIAELQGITVTEADAIAFADEVYGTGSYDSLVDSYTKGYVAQLALQAKVDEFLVTNAKIQ